MHDDKIQLRALEHHFMTYSAHPQNINVVNSDKFIIKKSNIYKGLLRFYPYFDPQL